jgi:hypothetical protein
MSAFDALALLERARQKLQAGKLEQAEACLELLADVLDAKPVLSTAVLAPSPRPQAIQPELLLRKKREANPVYPMVCQYLYDMRDNRNLDFENIKKYLKNNCAKTQLNETPSPSNGGPRYCRQLSQALEKLRKNGFIKKGNKKGSYTLIKLP